MPHLSVWRSVSTNPYNDLAHPSSFSEEDLYVGCTYKCTTQTFLSSYYYFQRIKDFQTFTASRTRHDTYPIIFQETIAKRSTRIISSTSANMLEYLNFCSTRPSKISNVIPRLQNKTCAMYCVPIGGWTFDLQLYNSIFYLKHICSLVSCSVNHYANILFFLFCFLRIKCDIERITETCNQYDSWQKCFCSILADKYCKNIKRTDLRSFHRDLLFIGWRNRFLANVLEIRKRASDKDSVT